MKSLEERLTALELKVKAILPKQEEPELKEPMLECTGGGWYLDAYTEAFYYGKSSDDCRIIGIEHETEAEAVEAGKRRKQQEIINNHATRLNNEDGFVADFNDYTQNKCCMAFDCSDNRWIIRRCRYIKPIGNVVMSLESAEYLYEKLNKGLITGVNANGDI